MGELQSTAAILTKFSKVIPSRCLICKKEITARIIELPESGKPIQLDVLCDTCEEPVESFKPTPRNFKAEWEQLCPKQFLDTDPAKIPEALLAEFRRYQYSNLGLVAIGPTGTWKSRCMHLVLRRLFYKGLRVKLLTAIQMGTAIADSFQCDGYGALVNNLVAVDCLSIDDFDKVKFTQRVQEAVFAIIDQRFQKKIPTFITMNINGEVLEDLFDPQYGPALRRRINESSRVINTKVVLGKLKP